MKITAKILEAAGCRREGMATWSLPIDRDFLRFVQLRDGEWVVETTWSGTEGGESFTDLAGLVESVFRLGCYAGGVRREQRFRDLLDL